MSQQLTPQPLTRGAFAVFGEVIDTGSASGADTMNDARFQRFDALAQADHEPDAAAIFSIARCARASSLPYEITLLERHPLGSQAFIPLTICEFTIVVAPAAERPDLSKLCAFTTNGHQGINYYRGVWHMPLIAFASAQEFLVVDSNDSKPNCDEFELHESIWLQAVST